MAIRANPLQQRPNRLIECARARGANRSLLCCWRLGNACLARRKKDTRGDAAKRYSADSSSHPLHPPPSTIRVAARGPSAQPRLDKSIHPLRVVGLIDGEAGKAPVSLGMSEASQGKPRKGAPENSPRREPWEARPRKSKPRNGAQELYHPPVRQIAPNPCRNADRRLETATPDGQVALPLRGP